MNERIIQFLESSFIGPLLQDENVTDISYNGVNIFYQHNLKGRIKADIYVEKSEAIDFIRQIANLSEKQFSFTVPILDINVGKFRINAVHPSLVRVGDDRAISFSVRIASSTSRIRGNVEFMCDEINDLLLSLINSGQSIVIGGPTGSGKTELQKYLLSSLPKNSRVIVIDNIQELENIRSNDEIDMTSWQVNIHSQEGTFDELIKNALRSNPDWLVVSEARGKEMAQVLNSAMTGHPIITTMHAKNVRTMPHRIVRMVEMNGTIETYEDILSDLSEHIRFYVFVNKKIDEQGIVHRFVESVGELCESNMQILFERKNPNITGYLNKESRKE